MKANLRKIKCVEREYFTTILVNLLMMAFGAIIPSMDEANCIANSLKHSKIPSISWTSIK